MAPPFQAARWPVVVLAGLLMAVTGCSSVASASRTEHLHDQFALLQRMRVATFWDDQDCTYFAYARGVFAADPADIGCWVNGQPDAKVFDEEAQKDFDAVRAAFAAGSEPLDYAAVGYRSGAIDGGSWFQFDRCTSYVYEPGYTGPGDIDEDATYIPIDEDWYAIAC